MLHNLYGQVISAYKILEMVNPGEACRTMAHKGKKTVPLSFQNIIDIIEFHYHIKLIFLYIKKQKQN